MRQFIYTISRCVNKITLTIIFVNVDSGRNVGGKFLNFVTRLMLKV